MNLLVQGLSTHTPNANKHFRAWYERTYPEADFIQLIMHPLVMHQLGVFKQYFVSEFNVDITISERGYDIYAAKVTDEVRNDFRFNEIDGDFYIERIWDKPINNEAYRDKLELRYEYWTIRAIYGVMEWIEIGKS